MSAKNNEWCEWVKIVKKVHKHNGITLSQNQALIIAKSSYPGKGGVFGVSNPEELEKRVSVDADNIPPNPVRQKKVKKEVEVAKTYQRDEEPKKKVARRKKKPVACAPPDEEDSEESEDDSDIED